MRMSFTILFFALISISAWSYWPTLLSAADRWANDPQYSHGYLVPLFSLYLLYMRRQNLEKLNLSQISTSEISLGFALFLVGIALRWVGTIFFLNGLDLFAMIPMLLGMALVLGGWTALKWSWPSICFLGFMVPLPFQIQTALAGKLQGIATKMCTYILQTIGTPAVSEGNVILINDMRIGVVEACSGLGMVMTFAALAFAMALIVQSSPLWIRLSLLAGAIPVAILSNVIRITLTGQFYYWNYGDAARIVFHDFAGYIMMPIAVSLLLLERFVLHRLIIEEGSEYSEPERIPIPFVKKSKNKTASVRS